MTVGRTRSEFGSRSGLRSFGDAKLVEIQRGITEIRAARPLLIRGGGGAAAAVLPVERLDDHRLDEFRALCNGDALALAVTAARARVLGIAGERAAMLTLPKAMNAQAILALAADKAAPALPSTTADSAAHAALALAKLARRLPAVLIATAGVPTLADSTSMVCVDAAAVAAFRAELAQSLVIAAEAEVPLAGGLASRFVVFTDALGADTVAVVIGNPDAAKPVPVRLHSACLTGDVFGSRNCDCGEQLHLALAQIAQLGGGVILYLDQEGRGLGLANKMRAYRLQEGGLDTFEANRSLGFDDDERDYLVAARALEMLDVKRIQLLTNNPDKINGLVAAGIDVAGRLPLLAQVSRENRRYLAAKAIRAGHFLDSVVDALAAEG